MMRSTAVLLALVLCLRPAAAQTLPAAPSGLVGAWQFDVTPTGNIMMPTTRGTMTIAARGDSLEAKIVWTPGADGRTSPAQTLIGLARGDSATFQSIAEGSVSANAGVMQIRPVVTWSFALRDQALHGEISVDVPGVSVAIDPMPVRAVRAGK